MNIDSYGCYTIQSCLGQLGRDCYIHIPSAGIDSGRVITMWGYDTRGVDFTDHFEFVTIPTPGVDNAFYLVNRRSGLPLRARGDHVVQGVAVDATEAERTDPGAQWVLEPLLGDEFRIMSLLTGLYLAPKDFKTTDGTGLALVAAVLRPGVDDRVRHFRRLRRRHPDGQSFPEPAASKKARFATLEGLDTEAARPHAAGAARGGGPALLRGRRPVVPPEPAGPGVAVLHAAAVDPGSRVFDRRLDGIVERETEETTETGLTTIDAQSVMSTFSWSVSAEASAGYKGMGFSASMKLTTKLAGETKRTSETSAEHREQHQFVESILYPAIGHPYRLVTWRPVDRYELCRKDGSLVQSWDVVRTEQEVIDVFPRSVTIPPPAQSRRDPDRTARAQARKQVPVGA